VRRDHLAETTGDGVENIAKYVKKTKEDPNTGICSQKGVIRRKA
jgi:hypothetical protein